MKSFKTFLNEEQQALLEAGLARIHDHLSSGRSVGIISASLGDKTKKENDEAHKRLGKRLGELGYGKIQATGRSQWGPERSYVVPNITHDHIKKLGDEFEQQAVIHAQGKKAHLHYLKAAGKEKEGTQEAIGSKHFNTPNDYGVTILKGIGFNPKDTREPTRSFTFKEEADAGEYVLLSLEVPPSGQLNPFPKPYK